MMTKASTEIKLSRHDDIYEKLVALHDGLSEEDSRIVNAKLIIALINQVGDPDIVLDLIEKLQRR
ncbi:DUF2783 domain-containing protein [Parasphingorhabdus sp.]|uniref:DUF2783 domain-containing protein n=1 Tax=Parasphingorhabdus sp. TaxID=2709688 RepID=UPI0032659F41